MVVVAEKIYSSTPVWMQNAALTLYGLRISRARYGSIYQQTKEECLAQEWMSHNDLLDLQEERLLETIRHSYEYVPFYRRIMDELKLKPFDFKSREDLQKLPTIDKETIRRAGKDIVSTAVPFSNMHMSSSGGTTGTCVYFWSDPAGLQKFYAMFHTYQWRWAGIDYGEPWVMINGRKVVPQSCQRPPYWRYNAAAHQHFFSCFHIREETIGLYLEKMAELKTALLHLYPSNALALADYMKRHCLTGMVQPRSIITTSETLYHETRSLIEEQFQAKVYNHYTGDNAAQICECEKGGLHILPLFGYVEFEPIPNSDIPGACEMIITGLANRGSVLIRHRIGDVAVPSKEPCTCGRAMPTVDTLVGRTGDVVITPEGNMINASNLTDVFKDTLSILRCQFVQINTEEILARIEVTDQFSKADESRFRNEVHSRIGSSKRLEVEVVEAIQLTKSGKFRFVINQTSQ